MGRIIRALNLSVACALLLASQLSAEDATPALTTEVATENRSAVQQQRWTQLSKDERPRLRANAERWLRMAPEERRALRDLEAKRHRRITMEADRGLRDAGITLEPAQRAEFVRRYAHELRQIDRALRQEFMQKRRQEMAPVIEKLKSEFRASPAPSATPSAAT